jgi:hypothetical protein
LKMATGVGVSASAIIWRSIGCVAARWVLQGAKDADTQVAMEG